MSNYRIVTPPLWFIAQFLLLIWMIASERWYWAIGLALFLGANLGVVWEAWTTDLQRRRLEKL